MIKLLAYKYNDFVAKDGNKITGYNLWFGESRTNAVGCVPYKDPSFVSVAKLKEFGVELSDDVIGSECLLSYNRYGKIDNFKIV